VSRTSVRQCHKSARRRQCRRSRPPPRDTRTSDLPRRPHMLHRTRSARRCTMSAQTTARLKVCRTTGAPTILTVNQREAQLLQRDRATHYVSWNIVDCCIHNCAKNHTWQDLQYVNDLEGPSRSSDLPLLDRPYITSY